LGDGTLKAGLRAAAYNQGKRIDIPPRSAGSMTAPGLGAFLQGGSYEASRHLVCGIGTDGLAVRNHD
jgi:hypothetical protein